jgi:DSF synthase
MVPTLTYRPRVPADFPRWTFPTLDFEYHAASQSVWMYYKADGPPCFTFQTLADMADVRESLRALFHSDLRPRYPIRYFAMASRKAGVFTLGGDLAMFSPAIKNGQREILYAYAHACIDVVYGLATAFGLPIVTLSVVTRQALGGGLEAALAEDYLLASEGAKLGVPEVAFNSFPGMGAVSLLSRRVGTAVAEEIISTGTVYSGRQMFELGVVDLVSPEGRAHETALEWMSGGGEERQLRRLAMAVARRRCFPVSHEELIRITDLWADCSSEITPQDIRHMERLVSAQRRMLADA